MNMSKFDNGGYYLHINGDEITGGESVESIMLSLVPGGGKFCEVFPSKEGGALVFMHNLPSCPIACAFKTIREAAECASVIGEKSVSFLARLSGLYYLVYFPFEAGQAIPYLNEFAEPSAVSPDFLKHMFEHGEGVIGPNAAKIVKEYFI